MFDEKKENIELDITPDEKAKILSNMLNIYFNIDIKMEPYKCHHDFIIQIYEYYEKMGIEIEHNENDLKNLILAKLGFEQAYNFSILSKQEKNLNDVVISCFLSDCLENQFKRNI